MPDEVMTDEQFEQLLADKRQKELLGAIRKLSVDKADDKIAVSIQRIADRFEQSVNSIIKKVEQIEVKVELPEQPEAADDNSDEKLIKAISDMKEQIGKDLANLALLLTEKKATWTFDVQRDSRGNIETIKANKNI